MKPHSKRVRVLHLHHPEVSETCVNANLAYILTASTLESCRTWAVGIIVFVLLVSHTVSRYYHTFVGTETTLWPKIIFSACVTLMNYFASQSAQLPRCALTQSQQISGELPFTLCESLVLFTDRTQKYHGVYSPLIHINAQRRRRLSFHHNLRNDSSKPTPCQ